MARTSYTQLTLKHLKAEGWEPWMVERWLSIPPNIDKLGKQLWAAAKGTGCVPVATAIKLIREALGYRGGRRVDLFNLVDIVAYRDGEFIGVQSTGPSGHAAHRREMLQNEHLPRVIRAGMKVVLYSWQKKLAKPGGKAMRWKPRIEEIET